MHNNSRQQLPRDHIPTALNIGLLAALIGLHGLILFVAPLGYLQWPLPIALLLLAALASTTLWALVHETIHGLLVPGRYANHYLGRVLAIVHGCPLRLLRHGHLHHHRNSRGPADRSEVYDPARQSKASAAVAHYLRVLGGLYLAELLFNMIIFLPRHYLDMLLQGVHPGAEHDADLQRARKEMLDPAALRELRMDALLVILLYGAAFWLYGALWWWLALVLWWRAVAISMLDNSFHYGTPLNDRFYALNLRLPAWASRLLLNFNMHRAHHNDVSCCWIRLPRIAEYWAGDPGFLRAIARQLRGPIALDDPAINLSKPPRG